MPHTVHAAFGCGDPKKLLCVEDNRSFEILEKTTKQVGDRFESGLLWKKDNTKLPNNYKTALHRFNIMESDPQYRDTYLSKIQEYVNKGYATEISEHETKEKNHRTWYLPHFGVLNKNKPGKFRLVFDASSITEGNSLNSNLLSGPDLNQPLISVLFKFRENKVGVCGDIAEMFHQIKIIKEDQDSQRFLFRNHRSEPIKTYKMQVMTFDDMNMDIGTKNPKILGLFWNLKADCFTFKTNLERISSSLIQFKSSPTKREPLSIVMSLFDPFGFAANYTINGKLLLQGVWKEGIGWDAEISGEFVQILRNWLKQLPNVENLSIPRCHEEKLSTSNIQLHIFVDASSQAFAAVAYFRIICGN